MADNTKIEWCDASWSPITGCTPISEGCAHCYAKKMATRLKGRFGYPEDDPFKVTFHPDRLTHPLKWKKPKRIFVCSMGDLFHKDVSYRWIDQVFLMPVLCPQHTFLILTKRPDVMAFYLQDRMLPGRLVPKHLQRIQWLLQIQWPLPNVWLGVTAENQKTADERIPILLQIPAAVRFVSIEPMLGPIDLNKRELLIDKSRFKYTVGNYLDWVITGAETGPGARYMNPDWARDIRDQCKQANVPFFIKKISNKSPIPDDLMIREHPE